MTKRAGLAAYISVSIDIFVTYSSLWLLLVADYFMMVGWRCALYNKGQVAWLKSEVRKWMVGGQWVWRQQLSFFGQVAATLFNLKIASKCNWSWKQWRKGTGIKATVTPGYQQLSHLFTFRSTAYQHFLGDSPTQRCHIKQLLGLVNMPRLLCQSNPFFWCWADVKFAVVQRVLSSPTAVLL